jgi:hypothetical protein
MATTSWRRLSVLGALVVCVTSLATPAAAKSYSADRFDSLIRVLPDGSLDVTETVVFRFAEGTFTEVFREIPLRRTDGIDVVTAAMQGQRLPFGTERGTVEVRRRSTRIRVVWRFGPVEGTTREFVLNYRVRGAVRQQADGDVVVWRATPGEHAYPIASSTIVFELPEKVAQPPIVVSRRTESPLVTTTDRGVRIHATRLRSNGWIDTTLAFPGGSLIAAPPEWQQHAARVAAQSTAWIIGAVAVAACGLVLLIAWRQSYDAPPREAAGGAADWPQASPPDNLAPSLAGVLAAHGRTSLEHAMAALFALADRGEIEIREKPRSPLRQRDFLVVRRADSPHQTGYERTLLETIFEGARSPESTVSLSQARSRMTRRLRRFSVEMNRELRASGLLDDDRKTLRDRYNLAAIWLLALAFLAGVIAVLMIPDRGAWPLLVPASLVLLAALALIFAATITPLSNEGVRRAVRWRSYRRHLADVAAGKRTTPGMPEPAVLSLAVALGLANAWSKRLKHEPHAAPPWFHALPDEDRAAFPAFIASGGAGAGSGGGAHGGGAGAAGGGASGAH